jgi:hypothetical protein
MMGLGGLFLFVFSIYLLAEMGNDRLVSSLLLSPWVMSSFIAGQASIAVVMIFLWIMK